MRPTRRPLVVLLALGVILLVGYGVQALRGDSSSDVPTVSESSLPAEVQETLDLIDAGGPFPYEEDGDVFENREGLLPEHETGYYREYTVPTPGSDDRGARRLVVGDGGEVFYTDDHYASFERVKR